MAFFAVLALVMTFLEFGLFNLYLSVRPIAVIPQIMARFKTFVTDFALVWANDCLIYFFKVLFLQLIFMLLHHVLVQVFLHTIGSVT